MAFERNGRGGRHFVSRLIQHRRFLHSPGVFAWSAPILLSNCKRTLIFGIISLGAESRIVARTAWVRTQATQTFFSPRPFFFVNYFFGSIIRILSINEGGFAFFMSLFGAGFGISTCLINVYHCTRSYRLVTISKQNIPGGVEL